MRSSVWTVICRILLEATQSQEVTNKLSSFDADKESLDVFLARFRISLLRKIIAGVIAENQASEF